MSESSGIPMVCATSVMKPGRARIGQLGGGITLPRTVPIVNLVAAIVGALVGLVFSMAFAGFQGIAIGMGIGAGAGWMAVSYSPLKNESLMKWFELKFKSQTRTRYIDGRRVTVAVGIAVVTAPSSGPVRLQRSAVRVPAGQYDERGAARSARNQNLDGANVDPSLFSGGSVPHAGATPLPLDRPAPETRRSRRERPSAPALSAPVRPPATPAASSYEPMAGPARRLKD